MSVIFVRYIMTILQLIAMVWVFGCLLLYAYSDYKGRKIVDYLQRNYPEKWEDLGKPQPSFAVPNQTWLQFLSKEEYTSIKDRQLTRMCEKQRRLEKVFLALAALFFVLFGSIAFWVQYVN